MQKLNLALKRGLISCALLFSASAHGQQLPFFDWVKGLEGYHNMMNVVSNYANQMTTDAAGNIYLAGRFSHGLDFDPGAGVDSLYGTGFSAYIAKYDAAGNHLWARAMTPEAEAKSIALDNAGNIFVGGFFRGTVDMDPGPGVANLVSKGSDDYFIAKYNNAGNYLWAISVGGAQGDQVNSIQVDAGGDVYATGFIHNSSNPNIDFDPKNPGTKTIQFTSVRDGFVARYDGNGNCKWARHIQGGDGDSGDKLVLDNAGNVWIAGYTSGCTFEGSPGYTAGHGQIDGFVAKYSSTGSFIWAKTYGGPQIEFINGLALDKTGNAYVTGLFYGNTNFDPGNPAADFTSKGLSDIFVLKLSNSGDYVWGKTYGTAQDDNGLAITVDDSSNVYTGGYFTNTINFNNNTPASSHTSKGSSDLYLLKLTKDGNYGWSMGFGSAGADQLNHILVKNSKDIFFTAGIGKTADFNPTGTNGLITVNNPNPNDGFNTVFCKYKTTYQAPENIQAINEALLPDVYPNPARDQVVIERIADMEHSLVTITDITGKTYQLPIGRKQDKITVSINSLARGVYMLRCINTLTGATTTVKIEKE